MKYYDDIFIESVFPKALSESELQYYFEKYKSGDSNARKKIIQHNIRLVTGQVLGKFANSPYEKSELVSIGIIGLIKAVDSFNTLKNIKFSTYAIKCIDNEINMFFRSSKKHTKNDSLDKMLFSYQNGEELKMEEILYDENSNFVEDYESKESYLVIRKLVEQMPELDKKVVMLYFGFINDEPLTQTEIADRLNINQVSVSRILSKALKNISIQLKENGIIEKTYKKTKGKKIVRR